MLYAKQLKLFSGPPKCTTIVPKYGLNQINFKTKTNPLSVFHLSQTITTSTEIVPRIIHPPHNPLFEELHINGRIIRAMTDLGYKMPTPIQKAVVKPAIRGRDIVASALTGTGKTAAYLTPALHRLHLTMRREKDYRAALDGSSIVVHRKDLEFDPAVLPLRKCSSDNNYEIAEPLVLILAPTRELVEQVSENTRQLSKYLENVKILDIFGGVNEKSQMVKLRIGVDVLVATPGRLNKLLKMEPSPIDLSKVQTFIVDECDKMLSLGFAPDVFEIFSKVPRGNKKLEQSAIAPWTKTQTMMFSATLLPTVKDFVTRITPDHATVDLNTKMQVAEGVQHFVFEVTHQRKHALLRHFLARGGNVSLKDKQVLVFVATQTRADRLAELIKEDGFESAALHNNFSPFQREKIIQKFKEGLIQVLIGTDVLSRGLDIPDLPYVVNYDVPSNPEDYLHRVGRTGRAGNKGRTLMFVDKNPETYVVGSNVVEINEKHFLKNIEKFIKRDLTPTKVPGPWRDVSKSGNDVPVSPRLVELKEQRLREIQAKKESKYMSRIKMLQNRGLPVEKRKENVGETSLRDFKEGRYEDVMKKFDEKYARRRGFNPDDFKKGNKKHL